MPAGVEHAAIALLGHLADSAVRALALAAIAGLGLFLLRVRSAAIVLGVWTTVLGGALLMPVMGQLAPASWSLTIALPPNPVAPIETSGSWLSAATSRNAVATTQPNETLSTDLSIGVPPAPPHRRSASRPRWLAILGARIQIGVVDVQFADGSRWSYDLKAKRYFESGANQSVDTMSFPPSMSQLLERAAQTGRIDLLRGVFDAADIPAEDPFAAGAHRLTEPSLQAPNPTQPLVLGTDRTKPVRIVLIDAVIDATGHVLRVRTARSVDDSPGGIDQRALVLVRDATFTPAHFPASRFNGEVVTALVRVPVLVYY